MDSNFEDNHPNVIAFRPRLPFKRKRKLEIRGLLEDLNCFIEGNYKEDLVELEKRTISLSFLICEGIDAVRGNEQ